MEKKSVFEKDKKDWLVYAEYSDGDLGSGVRICYDDKWIHFEQMRDDYQGARINIESLQHLRRALKEISVEIKRKKKPPLSGACSAVPKKPKPVSPVERHSLSDILLGLGGGIKHEE